MTCHPKIACFLAAGAAAAGIAVGQQAQAPGAVPPKAPGNGIQVGEQSARAYAIEAGVPQRVPVRPGEPDSAMWEVDPRAAFAQAQREQRPLLLLFTADWNEKCLKLSEEVFSTKSFNEFAKETAVICYLNYPRNATDASDLFRQWKDRFKVMGFPNLLIFDPAGNVVREISGYTAGKPVTYFNEMKEVVHPLVAAAAERKAEMRKQGYRDWKNRDGAALFARFVSWSGDAVTLLGTNGETWSVTLATLTEEDQALARSFPEAATAARR